MQHAFALRNAYRRTPVKTSEGRPDWATAGVGGPVKRLLSEANSIACDNAASQEGC